MYKPSSSSSFSFFFFFFLISSMIMKLITYRTTIYCCFCLKTNNKQEMFLVKLACGPWL